jgi:hypothetical protein
VVGVGGADVGMARSLQVSSMNHDARWISGQAFVIGSGAINAVARSPSALPGVKCFHG